MAGMYIGAAVITVLAGAQYFPYARYRYWWHWLQSHRGLFFVCMAGFTVANAAAGLVAMGLVDGLGVARTSPWWLRSLTASGAALALLRGHLPRYGAVSNAGATVLGRVGAWSTTALDERAESEMHRYCKGLSLAGAVGLADYLHTQPSETGRRALRRTPVLQKNDLLRVSKARATLERPSTDPSVDERDPKDASRIRRPPSAASKELWSPREACDEMQSLCLTVMHDKRTALTASEQAEYRSAAVGAGGAAGVTSQTGAGSKAVPPTVS